MKGGCMRRCVRTLTMGCMFRCRNAWHFVGHNSIMDNKQHRSRVDNRNGVERLGNCDVA
jgi:hypothetical protein